MGATMACSPSIERGRYLGSPDALIELRWRTEPERALMDALGGLALSDDEGGAMVAACSSAPVSLRSADWRREWRVMVLASGESSTSFFLDGGRSVDARAGGARLMALVRRAAASFFFVALSRSFSFSLESLCMTSARALLTEERPKDWRIELRVVGLLRTEAPLPDAASGGIAVAQVVVVYMSRAGRAFVRVVVGRRDV